MFSDTRKVWCRNFQLSNLNFRMADGPGDKCKEVVVVWSAKAWRGSVGIATCLHGGGGWGRVCAMEFLDKWEKKLGWMSFPGLLRYYALFHVMVFLLQMVNPGIGFVLDFDLEKILHGEVWRVVTFLFSTSGQSGLGAMSLLFIYFMVIIAFMVSDGLEGAWGVFKTSMFLYAGYIGLLVAHIVFSLTFHKMFGIMISVPGTGFLIYTSAFFAFATLFPKVELMMFLVIPVQVRWLAAFGAIGVLLTIIQAPIMLGFVLFGFANYLLWAGLPALKGTARVVKASGRRKKFEAAKVSDGSAFHKCKKCGRTEVSDPDLEFRMATDGEEYCEDHLED